MMSGGKLSRSEGRPDFYRWRPCYFTSFRLCDLTHLRVPPSSVIQPSTPSSQKRRRNTSHTHHPSLQPAITKNVPRTKGVPAQLLLLSYPSTIVHRTTYRNFENHEVNSRRGLAGVLDRTMEISRRRLGSSNIRGFSHLHDDSTQ